MRVVVSQALRVNRATVSFLTFSFYFLVDDPAIVSFLFVLWPDHQKDKKENERP
jgi:hypothetical protein